MAGAGFKTFNTGDVLTASDVNTYLMQQTVMVFDDASARSTALPTPSEGMFSYLKDTNLTYRYDGSAWLSDAGTTSPLTTKGDVWGYSTADARIPVGADGTVLTADSAEALGVKWAAAGSGLSAATQAEMESASSTTVAVTPGRAQYHPSAAKFWVYFTGTSTVTIQASYNMTSITDNGTGYYTINIATDFSSGNYSVVGGCEKLSGASSASTLTGTSFSGAFNTGDFGIQTFDMNGNLVDSGRVFCVGYGDQ